jgi:hypothetical protein
MAHPDHDQAIGRLVGARLRGAADRRAVSGAAAESHPDAEAWAAYLDGGLGADEVVRLETHLAGCPVCRRLLAVLAPEVSSDAAHDSREVEAPAAVRGVVIPFPRRQVFAWMAAAAGLLMAVTLWSVSWLGGDPPVASVAMSERPAGPAAPLSAPQAGSPVPEPVDPAATASAPRSRPADAKTVDQVAGRTPVAAEGSAARQEQDTRKPDSRSDALARQSTEANALEAQRLTQAAASAAITRELQLQSNTATATAGARSRGPLANQQANQQTGSPQQTPVAAQAPPLAKSPPPPPPATSAAPAVARATPAPAPTPAAEPVAPPAQADAAAAVTRERRANEESASQLAETVTITSSGADARRAPARPQSERSQVAGAERERQVRSKDEAATPAAFAFIAAASPLTSFAEPGGRLRWRVADGLRLESSSDGGNRWTRQYTARNRLRAGTAPAIDSAWAVGEGGLVLRFVVPGGWAEVAPPALATLVAVSATGAQSARVTADDGRVFETADGGATWTPVAPGAGPR